MQNLSNMLNPLLLLIVGTHQNQRVKNLKDLNLKPPKFMNM